MANNFIDIQSQTAIIATAFDNMTVEPLRPKYIFDGLAQEKSWNLNSSPTKGDALSFVVLSAFSANTAALDPTSLAYNGGTKTAYTRRSVALEAYGNYSAVDVFEFAPEAFVDSMADVAFSLQDQGMNSLNKISRAAIDKNKFRDEISGALSTTYHFYASNATVGSMGPLRAIDVRKVVAKMKADNVPTYEDGNYVAVVSPEVATQLRAETGNAAWGAAVLSGDTSILRRFNGEIGTFEGVRFIVNNEVFKSGATYSNYFMGRDGVGKAIGRDLAVSMKPELEGPHSNIAIVRWNALVGYKVIRRESIRIVSSTSTLK